MSQFDRSELVTLAELSYRNGHFSDVIGYIKEIFKKGTPVSYKEERLVVDSCILLKQPFFNTLNFCDDSNLDEKIRGELQTKAKTAINRISNEAIELLDSYWVKRDDSNEAVAHYKGFKALQYHDKVLVASGEDKENLISKSLELYDEALEIAKNHLSPAHPVRLFITVNFSCFQYYGLHSINNSHATLKDGFENGQLCLSVLPEELKYYAETLLKYIALYIDTLELYYPFLV